MFKNTKGPPILQELTYLINICISSVHLNIKFIKLVKYINQDARYVFKFSSFNRLKNLIFLCSTKNNLNSLLS